MDRPPFAISYQKLALCKIEPAKRGRRFSVDAPLFADWWSRKKIEQYDDNGCTFCFFECDYGICDTRIWLPVDAAMGYCWECHTACTGMNETWETLKYDRPDDINYGGLEEFKRKIAVTPLKELGNTYRYRKVAQAFSSNPARIQALQIVHPKSAFDEFVKLEAERREGASLATAWQGAVPVLPPLATNSADGRPRARSVSSSNVCGRASMINEGRAVGPSSVLEGAKGPSKLGPPLPFLSNRLPRPSPLSTVTDISPPSNKAADSNAELVSTEGGTPTTPTRPARNPTASNATSGDCNNSTALLNNDTDTTMTDAPTTEVFNCISIPASPVSSQRSATIEFSPEQRPGLRRAATTDGITPMAPPRHPGLRRTLSAIDGMDISQYKPITFCRGSPWRQIDVLKAKICDECRFDKFSIIKHRHTEWKLLANEEPMNAAGEPLDVERRRRNCMICPHQGLYLCVGCPLRLCGNCQTTMETQCKSHSCSWFKRPKK